jgi:hypothetical protein
MPALIHSGSLKLVRLDVPLEKFPELLAKHRESDPTTVLVEALGAQYVSNGFRSSDTPGFVLEVCKWGHYAGVAGRVLKHNELLTVTECFRDAHAALLSGDPYEAIRRVTSLRYLAVSFGSKHLKFLAPDHAVVLDEIISQRLGYPRTADDYVEFLEDCGQVRDILNEQGIRASDDQELWRVSDVEMAIFSWLCS